MSLLPQDRGNILRFDADRWARGMAIPAPESGVPDQARWRESIDRAPALVYLLTCTRQDAYAIGMAEDRAAIARMQGQLIARQPSGHRQWPAMVWVQAMASVDRARRRVTTLQRWPHAWRRQLVERSNPVWCDLDDMLFHRPHHQWQYVRETGPATPDADDASRQAAADIARQSIAALPERCDWGGPEASWWYARVKAAPWGVSVFACSRRHPCRIVARPGRILEATLASLLGWNRARELACGKLPPWRWVGFEPCATEAEARSRQQVLQQWPQPWIRRLVADENPDWLALEALLVGCHPNQLEAIRVPMA